MDANNIVTLFTAALSLMLLVTQPGAESLRPAGDKDYQITLDKLSHSLAKARTRKSRLNALDQRAGFFIRHNDFARALDDINEIITISPDRIDLYPYRGLAYAILGQLDKAESDYNVPFRRGAANWRHRVQRGAFFWSYRGDLRRALIDIDEAVDEAGSRDNTPRLQRANIYREAGHFDLALADIEAAIRLSPRDPILYNARSLVFRYSGNWKAAFADANRAIDLDPKSSFALMNRGELYRMRGELDKAIADLDAAISVNPAQTSAYTMRANLHRFRGDYAKARVDIEVALARAPNNAQALAARGLLNERLGQYDAARSDFSKVLTLSVHEHGELSQDAHKTARARIAAFDTGVAQPKISPLPGAAKNEHTIHTNTAIAPPEAKRAKLVERRVALVIGNAAYSTLEELANPIKDAEIVASSLRHIGFATVSVAVNTRREDLISALRAFSEEAEKADWALIYYAGHGVEVDGANFLIPVDARLAADRDVQLEAVSLDQVMSSVDGARKLKLVILDACRDNPFASRLRASALPAQLSNGTRDRSTRSIGRGLANVTVSGATLVVYSAKHGQVALDGEGANSPFVVALTQRIGTPGVEINKVLRLVRDDVMEATAARQEPYMYGSLPGREDFFFVER